MEGLSHSGGTSFFLNTEFDLLWRISGSNNKFIMLIKNPRVPCQSTHQNHEDDADNESLVSGFGIVQKVPVDMHNSKSNGSNRANKSNNAEIDWNHFPHCGRIFQQKSVPKPISNSNTQKRSRSGFQKLYIQTRLEKRSSWYKPHLGVYGRRDAMLFVGVRIIVFE